MLEGLFIPLRDVVRFLQPYVQPQPWARVEFTSSWTSEGFGTTAQIVEHRKDPLGRVHLRGVAKRTGASNDMFQLPEGERPPRTLLCAMSSNSLFALVQVATSGMVTYVSGGDPTVWVSLSGLSFDTEE